MVRIAFCRSHVIFDTTTEGLLKILQQLHYVAALLFPLSDDFFHLIGHGLLLLVAEFEVAQLIYHTVITVLVVIIGKIGVIIQKAFWIISAHLCESLSAQL